MATPSLRVFWPDAHSRAGWADPPNWRRPGLTLSGSDGAPLLAEVLAELLDAEGRLEAQIGVRFSSATQ